MKEMEATELSWLSLAYIDAGIYLAEAIANDDFSDSKHRTLVPIFLLHQGLELLYKGALKAKQLSYPKTHDLRKLKSEFNKHFPELDFEIPGAVLGPESTLNDNLFPDMLEDPPAILQHERLRYPTDRRGRIWAQFEPPDLKESINEIKNLNQPTVKCWLKIMELSGAA